MKNIGRLKRIYFYINPDAIIVLSAPTMPGFSLSVNVLRFPVDNTSLSEYF